jgi:hypothetical protein
MVATSIDRARLVWKFTSADASTLPADLLAQLTKEFVEHLLSYRLYQTRAHRRNQSADLAL